MDHPEPVWRERALREAVLAGDADAWKAFYDENFGPLFAYVHCRTGRRIEDTEEIVQETWLVAVKKIARFDPGRGGFEGWLRGIADNVVSSYRRRAARLPRSLDGAGESVPSALEVSAGTAEGDGPENLAEEIALVLTGLPGRYQAVIRAKYQDELPVAEIAERWGETPKAVESLLSRARAAFRAAFDRSHEHRRRGGGAETAKPKEDL
jgi:RNA polymerase sigma-70 factor (ECF subfamily)